ncbi:alanine racemase [Minwuia sp.]|uniref:alanine racemase n=1 Tax=Minwuia sp. TaxID=2493630 RepID=UPI003A927B5E
MLSPSFFTSTLSIDVAALARNWQRLDAMTGAAETGAAVKANAYGIGIGPAVNALHGAGCRTFFVAHPSEGIAARAALTECTARDVQTGSDIYVLNGLPHGAARDYEAHGLRPVLCEPGQIERWRAHAKARGRRLPCAIQIDTGMTRLGLLGRDVERLTESPDLLDGLDVQLWITHPSCADHPDHPLNQEQRSLFLARVAGLPAARLSFANSAGIFLGPDWHMDLCRPGIALYGSNPDAMTGAPMDEVVHLSARILQVHDIDRPRFVGYGATHPVPVGRRIATCGVGYADGYMRSLSNLGYGMLAGHRVPLVGRVSMDLITFDITDVPEHDIGPESEISIIGGGVDIDELAALGGTIAYELLTGLGNRFARRYLNGVAA